MCTNDLRINTISGVLLFVKNSFKIGHLCAASGT